MQKPIVINNNFNNFPEQTKFLMIFPNPFSTKTTITYQINEDSEVELSIYDVFGRRVAVLVNEHQQAGNYSIDWLSKDTKGNQLSNGLFVYQLKTNNNSVQTRKAILIK